jgi:inorganic phosphate transporter, PiT family
MEAVLLVAAGLFAVLNGANDGGTLVAMGLKIPSAKPLAALLLLSAAVGATPILLGTAVATTLAERLVSFEGSSGQLGLLVAIAVATAVVVALTRLSLPTSLTLSLVGAMTGAGWASGLAVSWTVLAFVLALAAAAPLVGAALAFALSRVALRISAPGGAHRKVRRLHQLAFTMQCVAYGANDGQKMLAVFLVAFGTIGQPPSMAVLFIIGVLFMFGAAIGVRRFSGTLATGVLPARPLNFVAAELSAASSVLGSAALGAPVSMTQAVTGGLIGSGINEGYRRIRWKTALHIVIAWGVTLPTAAVVAAIGAAIVNRLALLTG